MSRSEKIVSVIRDIARPLGIHALIFTVTTVPILAGLTDAIWPGAGQRFALTVTTYLAGVPAAYWGALGVCFGAYAAARSFDKAQSEGESP